LRRCARTVAAAAFLVLGVALGACGGAGMPASTPPPTAALGQKTAEQRMPDLSDLGFEPVQSAPEPLSSPQWEGHRTLYRNGRTGEQVMVIAYVGADPAFAEQQFAAMAEALKNPPPAVFGAQAVMVDDVAPPLGDERRSYRARDPDSQGNTVWTDIYRREAVVVIVQYLGPATGDAMRVRTTAADRALQ